MGAQQHHVFLRGAKLQSPTVYPIGHFFFAPHPGADRVEMRTKQLAVMPKTSWPKRKGPPKNGKLMNLRTLN